MNRDELVQFSLTTHSRGRTRLTEAQWLSAKDPIQLLPHLATEAYLRRLRLFLCGCFRIRAQEKWAEDRLGYDRAAVELAEQWADALVNQAEVFASGVVRPHVIDLFPNDGELRHRAAEAAITKHDPPYTTSVAEQLVRANVLRDVFGNPFRPVVFDAAWRTDTAVSLAKGMYESRDFSAMPILADALQDAGCDSDDVLNHCRDEKQTHVRGCWVVDLVLEKS